MFLAIQPFCETVRWHLGTREVAESGLAESDHIPDPVVSNADMAVRWLVFSFPDVCDAGFVVVVDGDRIVVGVVVERFLEVANLHIVHCHRQGNVFRVRC